MTSFSNRPNTALVVVDVQNDVVANAHDRDAVVTNIATLVEKARAEQVPVIWVQHSSDELPQGATGWQYVPELPQLEAEPMVHKRHGVPRPADERGPGSPDYGDQFAPAIFQVRSHLLRLK